MLSWILKLGVWARTQIERDTSLGVEMRDRFYGYESNRLKRRRTAPADAEGSGGTSD